jgi:hypothetical protein
VDDPVRGQRCDHGGVQGASQQPGLPDRIARGELLGPRLFVFGPQFWGKEITPEEGARRVREYKQAGFDGLKVSEELTLATYQAIARAARQEKMPLAGHVPNAVGLERALAAGQKSIEHLDGYVEALAGDDLAAKSASSAGWSRDQGRAYTVSRPSSSTVGSGRGQSYLTVGSDRRGS